MNLDYPPEEKYFLMLLYAPNGQGKLGIALRGSTWLQKEMFLLAKNNSELRDLHFDEHLYGPFSPALESINHQYLNSELIKQNFDNGPIRLTEKGIKEAEAVWQRATDAEKDMVSKIKQLLNDMDSKELIAYIYSAYPETTKNSDVVDEFEKTRVDSALALIKRGKVSVGRAAIIAGKPIEDLIELAKKKKIALFQHQTGSFAEELRSLERRA